MATYTVVPRVERAGFHVAIEGSDGIRQTMILVANSGAAGAQY